MRRISLDCTPGSPNTTTSIGTELVMTRSTESSWIGKATLEQIRKSWPCSANCSSVRPAAHDPHTADKAAGRCWLITPGTSPSPPKLILVIGRPLLTTHPSPDAQCDSCHSANG